MIGRTPKAKATAAIAAAGVLALLSGCTVSSPETAPTPPPTSLTIGTVGELTSFNPSTAADATSGNLAAQQFLHESFAYIGDDLQVAGNTGFGEVERISDDPLTVVYTLNDGRKWSDGKPVTLEDLMFGWAVNSGWFDDASYDEAGNLISGTQYFDTAEKSDGFRDTSRAKLDTREGTLTLVYDEPFADWNRQWLLDRPLHTVAAKAGVTSAQIMQAIRETPQGDPGNPVAPNPVLLAAAQAWQTGFEVDPAAPDLSAAVSNGPYMAESWSGDTLNLVRNPEYNGENYPAFDNLAVRYFPDQQAQLAAVRSGEVDMANLGNLTAPTIDRLEASGATVLTGSRPHTLSLIFVDEGGRMDDNLREALALSLDRERMVDESVRGTNPDAAPLRSFLSSPASGSAYDDIVANNGSPGNGADPDRARDLLDGDTPQVRIRYEPTDTVAADLFAEIARMADEVGIDVRPAGDDDAADAELVSSDVSGSLYEVARERVRRGAGGLEAVRALAQMRESTDPEQVIQVAQQVDRALFDDHYGVPLVALSGVIAHTDAVRDVVYTASEWEGPSEFWSWQPND
ncbi:ABC transporter substrate-binding protein [Microbacterium sp. P05]|uniref:ABC transporter substrate-binding protein n=1 Tax=Microbacterium sp. P05 TaxID=3366948 RepID=UPI003747014F